MATYSNVIAFVLGTGADGSVAALSTSNPPEATVHRLGLFGALAPAATTFDAALEVTSPMPMLVAVLDLRVIGANSGDHGSMGAVAGRASGLSVAQSATGHVHAGGRGLVRHGPDRLQPTWNKAPVCVRDPTRPTR